jgi:hypothetical protein
MSSAFEMRSDSGAARNGEADDMKGGKTVGQECDETENETISEADPHDSLFSTGTRQRL